MRVDDQAISPKPDSGDAEDGGLPQAAKRGHVHASRGIAHVSGQIDLGGLLEVLRSQPDIA